MKRITLSHRAYMQFHNHDRQLISLCEIRMGLGLGGDIGPSAVP